MKFCKSPQRRYQNIFRWMENFPSNYYYFAPRKFKNPPPDLRRRNMNDSLFLLLIGKRRSRYFVLVCFRHLASGFYIRALVQFLILSQRLSSLAKRNSEESGPSYLDLLQSKGRQNRCDSGLFFPLD